MQTQPKPTREIVYDRFTRDFAASLDGELVGYFASYALAEEALDQIVYASLTKAQPVAEAVEDYRGELATSADLDAFAAEWDASADAEHDSVLAYADAWNADARQRVRADVVLLPDELVIINALRAIEGAWARKVAA